ncbi:MAG: hypothetical protein HY912_15245 [Desulfomonile tiedjei]|uniref:VWFA domain-containing protein n=1 Tax=Desulfomonile tiedjei TaxID=2358 RepID=A0A9D6Z198_9BACT|nr:hypothetical protein [Desulfomonile tiedjei]
MSDRPEEQKSENLETPQVRSPIHVSKKRGIFKFLILIVIIVGSAVAAYNVGIQVGSTKKGDAVSPSSASFSREPSGNLFSSSSLLKDVGQSPVDPSKVLLPALERSLDPKGERKPKSCPPGQLVGSAASGPVAVAAKAGDQRSVAGATAPQPVDTPVIVTVQPNETVVSEPQEPAVSGPVSEPAKQEVQQTSPPPADGPKKHDRRQSDAPSGSLTKAHDQEDRSKNEQFQLPGSVTVKIQNYSGTPAKWGLMVIVDDSASMGRKNRVWSGGRLKVAQAAVAKLSEAVTPGSRVAVRDFQCNKAETDSKSKESACLSRMMLDWTESPFSGIKEKVENLSAAGKTNPCAAALYSLKKDFANQANLDPRVLIITDAAGKCSPSDVIKIAEHSVGKERVHIDVIALGVGKKRNSGYAALAKKTNGVFLKLEGPGDLDQAMARYAKTLKSPIMEKVEIRGEKAVFNAVPEEEIALTPGTYSIILPSVAGINPGKRTIPSVKVSSGEAVVIDVKVKKGRVSVSRSGKKNN